MLLITNEHSDPGSCGMFSKPGKFTSQKYSVFHKKDEILQDKPKYLRVSHFPQFDMNFNEADEKGGDDDLGAHSNAKKFEEHHFNFQKDQKPHMDWQKYTSRDDHFLTKQKEKIRMGGPRVGLYHPKKMTANKKILPDYTKELKLRPILNRFDWVDHRHMEEMKNLDIEVSDGKIRPRLIKTPYIDRQQSRHDLRNT